MTMSDATASPRTNFEGTVHGAEERALLLQFAAAALRLLLVDQPGIEVGVDRHLLAGNGIEREASAHLGDTGCPLGDDEEVHRDQDHEDDDSDDEIAAHHELREALDDVAGGVDALLTVRQDQARGGDAQGEPQQGRDQKDGGESREFEGLLNPERHHQDQHRQGDREGEADIDQYRRNRQEENRQDRDDAGRETEIPP